MDILRIFVFAYSKKEYTIHFLSNNYWMNRLQEMACVLVHFLSTWYKLKSSGKMKPQLSKYIHKIARRQAYRVISWWTIDAGLPQLCK